MDGFKEFLNESTEIDKDVQETLKDVPKKHAALLKNFKFKWINSSTLPKDKGHVGIIDPNKKTVIIASPWNYGRGYTLLHELAHQVWANFMTTQLRKEWDKIVAKNPKRDKKENSEENFCFAYASFYASNKMSKHDCPEWLEFIKKRVPK